MYVFESCNVYTNCKKLFCMNILLYEINHCTCYCTPFILKIIKFILSSSLEAF